MREIKLETTNLQLVFDEENGSLVSIYSTQSDWQVIKRPTLGLSWRIMVPIEGKRNNEAWGHEQETKPTCESGTDFVRFSWDKVKTRFGGVLNIGISTECRIENDQPVFYMHIDNADKYVVENVYYPYIGDLHRPENATTFKFEHGGYLGVETEELYPKFPSFYGTWSTDYPTICVEGADIPPMYPFGTFSDEKGNGLLLGIGERRIEVCTWQGEHLPGWKNSNDFRVYDEDQVDGREVYTRFAVGHLPYVMPGTEFDLLPFFMDAYVGDWSVGALCYRKRSAEWSSLPDTIPEWAKNPHAWMQLQINSPEDELRMQYKDLPKIAEECKKYGVQVIQLTGWNKGGQDRGNPCHETDPRLGTREDLKCAIKEIQEMGIKLILFAKFTWADESRDDFKEVYEQYAIKNPYGNYYARNGYQYMSLSQLANVSTRRLIPMCYGSEGYRDICKEHFLSCLDLGADGILIDENETHYPTIACFDTSHGHRYGESSYKWDETLIQEFRKLTGGKEFMIAGEASYDFQHNYYDLSYGRTWGQDHRAYTRMLRPNSNIMTAVVGFEDRSMINQCLLNRYIISYEPYNFKGRLSDFPKTVAYGNKMDKLRTDFREYFWDGEFMNRIGASVCDENGREITSYAVYKGTNGKEGIVVCNYGDTAITVVPKLASGEELKYYRLVDNDELVEFETSFVIPAQSAAVVI